MAEQFSNFAVTTLNGSIGTGDASLVVFSATNFPSSGNYRILIDNEIMLVTGRTGTTLNVTRAQESTTVASHASGATVAAILTAGALAQLKTDAVATLAALVQSGSGDPSGVVSAPVGTLWLRTDGGTSTTLYVKESGGSGNTGWAAK